MPLNYDWLFARLSNHARDYKTRGNVEAWLYWDGHISKLYLLICNNAERLVSRG